MMRFLCFLLLSFCFKVFAAPAQIADKDLVALNFDRIPVVQLISVVYGDMLRDNFVLHPALASSDQVVTVHMESRMDKAKIRVFMVSFLASVGISVQDKGGYLFLVQASSKDVDEDGREVFFYRPKYRTVGYITDLTSALFKFGRFSSQRGGVRSQPSVAAIFSAHGSGVQQQKTVDSGSSAYSVQDKGEPDALVFIGSAAEVGLLQKMIAQIDIAVGEVLVTGVVYEVSVTSSEGSAYAIAASVLGGRFGINIGKSGASGDLISITTPNFHAAIAALSSDNRFKSINNASIRVKSGATGTLSVGADVPVLGAVILGANGGSQQSITYQQSGVILNLSPTVRDGSVDLTIDEEISSFVPTVTGVTTSPTLMKRKITTTVGAGNEDVIVLGGLDVDSNNKGSSGPRFWSGLLKSMSGDTTKTEVVLIMNVKRL